MMYIVAVSDISNDDCIEIPLDDWCGVAHLGLSTADTEFVLDTLRK